MTPDEFRPLAERAIGKHAAPWEIERVFAMLEEFDSGHVAAVLAEFREPPKTSELVAAVRWRSHRAEARRKALESAAERCEHGRIDAPYDPCPECRPRYAAAAKSGADLCRSALRRSQRLPLARGVT